MAFDPKKLESFIGSGITLPLRLVNGRVPLDTGVPLIRASIRTIIAWPYGIRFFLNEFGSRVEELLEEPNDNILKNIANTFIADAITRWEPRVEFVGADYIRNDMGDSLDVELAYRIIATQQLDTFIFPFYRQITS